MPLTWYPDRIGGGIIVTRGSFCKRFSWVDQARAFCRQQNALWFWDETGRPST